MEGRPPTRRHGRDYGRGLSSLTREHRDRIKRTELRALTAVAGCATVPQSTLSSARSTTRDLTNLVRRSRTRFDCFRSLEAHARPRLSEVSDTRAVRHQFARVARAAHSPGARLRQRAGMSPDEDEEPMIRVPLPGLSGEHRARTANERGTGWRATHTPATGFWALCDL